MTRALEILEPDATDLPAIDLTAVDTGTWAGTGMRQFDRRTYEERYAELGFGLGTVPRRQRRDDAWWETPAGMLAVVVALLLLLWMSTTA